MPINFTQLFQDSWNFVRNKQKIILIFSLVFFLFQLCSSLILPHFATTDVMVALETNAVPNQDILLVVVFLQFVSFLLTSWYLVAIHQIAQGEPFDMAKSFVFFMPRLFGLILITFIVLFPMVVGIADVLFAFLHLAKPTIISLIAFILGIYVYVRFCLADVHYLLSGSSINQTLKTVWLSGFKRTSVLFIYCLLMNVVLPLFLRTLSKLSNNILLELIILGITAFVTLFSLVFTYRFYSVFMQKAS